MAVRRSAADAPTLGPIQWLTTAPNPRSPATRYDAGQRGWKLHAVRAEPTQLFASIGHYRALCGLWPRHGWGLDLFIDDRCRRCERLTRREGWNPQDDADAVHRAISMRHRTGR